MSDNRLTLVLQDDGTLDRVYEAYCAACQKHWSERWCFNDEAGGFPDIDQCQDDAEEAHSQDSPDCYDQPALTKGHDISVVNEGTVWLFCAETDKGLEWLKTHLQTESWQWLGNKSVAVDYRNGPPICTGIDLDGLRVDYGRIH